MLLLRYLQLIAVRGTSAMHLAEGDSLLSYLTVGLEPIEVLHDLIAHPFWEDIHQECPDQFGTELLMVIRFERAQHLLPLDDPSLDIFAFGLEVDDVHDHLREALIRLRIVCLVE